MTAASIFVAAALVVYFASNIPRSVTLPAEELTKKAEALLGQEKVVLEHPEIAEGDLVLSYSGGMNETANLWLDEATLSAHLQQLLDPTAAAPGPAPIRYTTDGAARVVKGDDTCHTTVAVRRAKGSTPLAALTLFQSDGTAGEQNFRQVVLDAGKTALEVTVHTDTPASERADLPGCHKLLTVGGKDPIPVGELPVVMEVESGKVSLYILPSVPSVRIWSSSDTFDRVSLGQGALRGSELLIVAMHPPARSKGEKLKVTATPAAGGVSIGGLQLGPGKLRFEVGQDPETAKAYANGESIYNYDLMAAMEKNMIVSSVIGVVLIPGLFKWTKKWCFPDAKETAAEVTRPAE